MYRFFSQPENLLEDKLVITGEDVNHIKNVLRMKKGEKLVVTFGQGDDYYCVIDDLLEEQILTSVLEKKKSDTELPVSITLFQCLPKKDKMELVIQKAVELGATAVVPVNSRRCVVKLDDKKAKKKLERWQAISMSAAKQSGRGVIPKISDVMDFKAAVAKMNSMDLAIMPYENADNMAESFSIFMKAIDVKSVGVLIGPEGGFDIKEVEYALTNGVKPVSLGKRILRTETAGLAILSTLMIMIEGKV